MIIGISSKACAGKGEATEFLKSKGFKTFSLSDILRKECDKRGIERTRDNLINIANELREKHGEGILSKIAIDMLTKNKEHDENLVIESLRKKGEIDELKKNENFLFIKIYTPAEKRFERMKARKREKDPQTYTEFLDFESKDPSGAFEEEGLTINNTGTLEEFHRNIEKALIHILNDMNNMNNK